MKSLFVLSCALALRGIMWLFTKHGFFSVVCARQGNGKHGQLIDTARLVVRARCASTSKP